MADLTLRRSRLERIEPLSVFTLAIAYAVLLSALCGEWGRFMRVFAADVAPSSDTAGLLLVERSAESP